MKKQSRPSNTSIFFSELLNKKVCDLSGKPVGSIFEIYVNTDVTYPRIHGIAIKGAKKTFEIPFAQVIAESLWDKKIYLNVNESDVQNLDSSAKNILPIKKALFDKQIVDLNGAKVVRVNDIHLLRSQNEVCITDVDIGISGLFRRLGIDAAIEKSLNKFFPSKHLGGLHKFISWKYVQAVAYKPATHTPVKISVPKEEFQNLNPADLADILEELDFEQRKQIIENIPDDIVAKVLSETDDKTTQEILEVQTEERIADILEEMPPDVAADILADMEENKAEDIISKMDSKDAETVSELLEHGENTAGGLMTTEYVAFSPSTIVVSAIQELIAKSGDVETIYDAFVVENAKLIGSITLKDLLISPGHKALSDIMNKKPRFATTDEKLKDVAEIFSKYNLITLPVVNEENGELDGIITVDDIVEELMSKW